MNIEGIQDYINNPIHNLSQTAIHGNCTIKLSYKPYQLMAFQDLKVHRNFNRAAFDSLETLYSDNLYFILSLSCDDKEFIQQAAGSRNNFTRQLNTLAFGMQEYVRLIVDAEDTIPLADGIMTNMFGYAESNDILLVFVNQHTDVTDLKVIVEGSKFGLFDHTYPFTKKDIKKIPISYNKLFNP